MSTKHGDELSSSGLPASSASKFTQQLGAQNFSVDQAIGGKLGIAEAVSPTLVLIIAYTLTKQLFWPVVMALGVSVLFAVFRLATRQSLKQVLVGLIGTAISAFWAWKTGKVEDFFTFGFWINAVYASVILVSILCRFPLIGWVVAAFSGKLDTWRTPTHREFYRRSLWATWAWVGLLVLRLLVELPLYYLRLTTALGAARIILGVPAFAFIVYLTWVLMRPVSAKDSADKDET